MYANASGIRHRRSRAHVHHGCSAKYKLLAFWRTHTQAEDTASGHPTPHVLVRDHGEEGFEFGLESACRARAVNAILKHTKMMSWVADNA